MRMRAPALLPIFRSELQLQLVALLFDQPEREWTTGELMSTLDTTPASLHRELHRLLDAGLITRRAVGRTLLYCAASDSPVFPALRELIGRTIGFEEELRRTLAEFSEIDLALIHGSWASGRVGPQSDVDVFIVGDAPYRELRTKLHRLGQRLGRRVDAVVFGREEFAQRLEEGNSFVRGALAGPNIPLVGRPAGVA
jgi:predicted nucleotidyltransferase